MADKPDLDGFIDAELLSQQEVTGGPAAAGQAGEEQRARRFGYQRQIDEWQREAGAFLGDDKVAVKEHGGPDTHAIAVNRRNDRDFTRRQRSQQAPDGDVGRVARQGGQEVGEIVARGEILAFAPDRNQANRRVRDRRLNRFRKCRIHGDRDRIAALGPGEGDRKNGVASFHPNMFAQFAASRIT